VTLRKGIKAIKSSAANNSDKMAAIRTRNTSLEMRVRRILFRLGYRYRIHVKTLPGCPDIVFSRKRKVIFAHGCFWHGHSCRHGATRSKTNTEFWTQKIITNMARDQKVELELRNLGWRVFVIWECELRDITEAERRLVAFLND
jgi:DNA mismatch endonuclease, patch repair protein